MIYQTAKIEKNVSDFGGTRDPSGGYRRADAHGFFWRITEYDSTHVWFYNLALYFP